MARKVLTEIKLQVPAGAANPAPPVGPALGQHGVNIMEFCKAFNAQTQDQGGTIIPVVITVFEDRSFTFITKTPPAAVLIKEAIGLEKGSAEPNRDKVGRISRDQVRRLAATKFDETVEVHFRLGLNVRHADQQLRGTLMLPHGSGREMRVAVFAEGEKAREAEEAGADVVGSADLAKQIEEGFDDFDVAVATPDQMGVVGRLGRILGPRGKMPNPKTGTVTMDVAKAVQDSKGGKLEYRTDRGANVHVPIGRKSFDKRQLVENYAAIIDEIVRAKPAASKGRYIRGITLTSTMGPGIHVDPARTRGIVDELEGQQEAVPA